MSGGSWDYLYLRVEDAAERMALDDKPMRKEFAVHLVLVAKALKAVELCDSFDCSPPQDSDAIKRALGFRELDGLLKRLESAPLAYMDTRAALGVCAINEEDFPALYALQGNRVRLVVDE